MPPRENAPRALDAPPHPLDLRHWDWTKTLLRAGIAALVLRLGLSRVAPLPSGLAGQIAWGAFESLIALRWIAGLPEGARRARAADRAGRAWPRRLLVLLVPADIAGLLRLQWVTAGGFLAWLLRRRPLPRPDGLRLEDRRRGSYDGLFLMNAISLVVEIPLMVLLLSSVRTPGIHLAIHGLEALAVVWVFGDRWLVHAGGHVLTPSHLDLRAGARAAARIPLDAIEAIAPMKEWALAHDVRRVETGTVSVIDKPNVVITLRPANGLAWTRLQVERPLPRHLLLYLDQPAALPGAVAAARRAAGLEPLPAAIASGGERVSA
jgi:hypothetical protein